MRRCDVLVVGGGPAGSTCARTLVRAGASVVLIDRARFPRDKVCAGWITPAVLDALQLSASEYAASGAHLQPFTSFATSVIGRAPVVTAFDRPVSYGLARREFDAFLLGRVRTCALEGTPLASLQRRNGDWIANDEIAAPVVVGAAGHFCPVARHVHASPADGRVVLARQVEIVLTPHERCAVDPARPELFFSRDLEGYGWCVRKGELLNVGIGRRVAVGFNRHVAAFAAYLGEEDKVPARARDVNAWHGHAYALAGGTRAAAGDGWLLVGDAAGLAAPESGEGIGPAVESGLRAAQTIAAARGRYGVEDLQGYSNWVRAQAPRMGIRDSLRACLPAAIGRTLLASPVFARQVVERLFLHQHGAAAPSASISA